MDYGRLNRRELQALCKEHGIPANKTNVFMAEALGALLNAKESHQVIDQESVPDPADIVQAKAKRAGRTKKISEVLAPNEVDDLASHLAQSTLTCDSSGASLPEAAVEVMEDDEPMAAEEIPSESPGETVVVILPSEIVVDNAKVRRKPRTKISRKGAKPEDTLADAADVMEVTNSEDATEEPLLEVVLDLPSAAVEEEASEEQSVLKATYSRRGAKAKQERESAATAVQDISSSIVAVAPPAECVLDIQEDSPSEISVPAPVDYSTSTEDIVDAKPLVKKSKAKGSRSKKVKPTALVIPQVQEDEFETIVLVDKECLLPTIISSAEVLKAPDSPAFGLAMEADTSPELLSSASLSPTAEDEAFEFQPVPESLSEIMTLAQPEEVEASAVKECQHRAKKSGKACRSCASKKIATLMTEVETLHSETYEEYQKEGERAAPLAEISVNVASEMLPTTPVKLDENKENTFKNIDLHSLSIRKLQKEVQRRGLSKRANTRAVKL